MTTAAYVPLTAAVVNFAVTLLVLSRNLRARVSWVYLLWGLSVSVWNLGVFFMYRAVTPEQAMFFGRLLQTGVIFLPVSLFHFCLLVARMPLPRMLPLLYGLHGLLLAADWGTELFIGSVRDAGYAYYTRGGPAYWVFAVSYAAVALYTTRMLARRVRELPPLHQRRLEVLLGANALLIIFGTHDLLPILGLTRYPFTDLTIYPVGSIGAIGYGVLVGYSALQHELLDVRIALSRVAAHLVRVVFVAFVGFVLLLFLAAWVPAWMPWVAVPSSAAVVMLSAVVASVYFPGLFDRSGERIERWMLGDQLEYRNRVLRFIRSVPLYGDMEQLMADLHPLLVQTMRVRRYQIFLLEQTNRVFALYRAHPEGVEPALSELRLDSPLPRYFQATHAAVLPFTIAYSPPAETGPEYAARQQCKEFAPDFCYPLMSGRELIGLLLLGEKATDQFYTPLDQELLRALVTNVGLVLNQFRLKTQVLLAEELELLGRMSRGMAHDLNNLITPVWTMLQLVSENSLTDDVRE